MPYALHSPFQQMGYSGNGISRIYQLADKDGTSHTDVLVLG